MHAVDFTCGSVALANIQGQVTLVQASRLPTPKDSYLEVETFTPFGFGTFITSDISSARISSSSLLAVLPPTSYARRPSSGIIEVPNETLVRITNMHAKEAKKHESVWKSLKSRLH